MRKSVVFLALALLICTGCSIGKPATTPPPSGVMVPPQGTPAETTSPGTQPDTTGQTKDTPPHPGPPPPTATEGALWASLPALKPEAVQMAGYDQRLDVAPDGQHLAYCTADGIRTSADGGGTWRTVATGPVAQMAAAGEFPVFNSAGPNQATCTGVLLDPGHPGSFYATFDAMHKPYGAPPLYQVGYYTTDSGHTWHHAPASASVTDGDFGSFQRRANDVVALFQTPVAQVTTDGGATWKPGTVGCLTGSNCVAFGAPQTQRGSCAMHEYNQPLLMSTDGGKSWTAAAIPERLNACNASQLAATGSGQAVTVTQWGNSPVLRTTDGGKTWAAIALPPVPHSAAGGALHAGLHLLPDGSLIGRDGETQSGDWVWLKPGAKQWCALPTVLISATASGVRSAGGRIWWVETNNNGAATGIGHVDLAQLKCTP